MAGVVLVISGIQNPDRAEIRQAVLDMGGKYRPDWTADSTHCVCAFAHTPKYNQVKAAGGTIVTRAWVEDSAKAKARLPERNYSLVTPPPSPSPSRSSTPPPRAAKNKKRKRGSDDESSGTNEYDIGDGFLVDDDEDDYYSGGDDDSDPEWDEDDSADSEELRRRLRKKRQDEEDRQKRKDKGGKKDTGNKKAKPAPAAVKVAVDSGDETEPAVATQDPAPPPPTLPTLNHSATLPMPAPANEDESLFFEGTVWLLIGNAAAPETKATKRLLYTHGAEVNATFEGNESYICVPEGTWDPVIDIAQHENPNVLVVSPSYVADCHKAKKRLKP
jgi:hypothetical protein